MNNEPNYKVLAIVAINGYKIELREFNNHWEVAETDRYGNTHIEVRNKYAVAEGIYNFAVMYRKTC